MKDLSGSVRLSTSRTEVNVEWIRLFVCRDCQMIASRLDIKKDNV